MSGRASPAAIDAESRTVIQLWQLWPAAVAVLALSICTGLLALTVPLFTRHVYDMAIPAKSTVTLTSLAVGGGIAMAFLVLGQLLRVAIVARFAGSLAGAWKQALVRRLLLAPPMRIMAVGNGFVRQRLIELERLRGLVISPALLALFDLPGVLISLLAIFLIGGWLVVVPGVALLLLLLWTASCQWLVRQRSGLDPEPAQTLRALQREWIDAGPALRDQGMARGWLDRYQRTVELAGRNGDQLQVISSIQQQGHYFVSQLTTLATMGLGVYLVMNGDLSTGSLIAGMMLARRTTQPLGAAASAFDRLRQARTKLASVDRVLQLHDDSQGGEDDRDLAGQAVRCDGVVFRYDQRQRPVLAGVSCELPAASCWAVAGANGSGKSSFLRLITGLIAPQSGSLRSGDRDLTHLNQRRLRRHHRLIEEGDLSLLADQSGTCISSFLQKRHPGRGRVAVDEEAARCGLLRQLRALGLDLDSSIGEVLARGHALPLLLCDALLSQPLLIAIDLPLHDGDEADRVALQMAIDACRERCTCCFSALQAGIMCMAANALILDEGKVAFCGPVQQPGTTDQEHPT